MSPAEYKQELKAFFASLSRGESEDSKLAKLDRFRKKPGVGRYLRVKA